MFPQNKFTTLSSINNVRRVLAQPTLVMRVLTAVIVFIFTLAVKLIAIADSINTHCADRIVTVVDIITAVTAKVPVLEVVR